MATTPNRKLLATGARQSTIIADEAIMAVYRNDVINVQRLADERSTRAEPRLARGFFLVLRCAPRDVF